ncbi:adenylate/guanylate cyclase domain-containing protein [Rhizobium sp. ARZ01]|uniref:adenylate/guanylate cyclase domain-containing protein n=1 Tax=Rhizobium sp. ARZ01 TaxID=2769313 RepID=UPI001781C9D1|nr:adenylate/guanylate cyclase domain-containing protein [Rhizobium sp. ARZ01]MBD9374947.1 adenylate/guanylate cyclase domain-containing protein [Rhizobium sp. ARZ01]
MDHQELHDIALWLSRQGYEGMDEAELIAGFCERCNAAGMSIARVLCLIDTLHPEFEGRAFQWDSLNTVSPVVEYAPTKEGRAKDVWEASIFHELLHGKADEIRRQFAKGAPADFYSLQELKDDGHTDYVAMIHRFTDRGRVGEMDAFSSHWTTRDENGFDEENLVALRALLPILALAIKCAASIRIIGTLAEIYLGRDAGRKVVSGHINRGEVEKIDAVIWFSDLHDYTRISDNSDPEQIIPFLNDYAELVISAVHDHGGNVLKLIGDGVLAIFRSSDRQADCAAALDAERSMHRNLSDLNARRRAAGLPATDVYLGLHVGEVFYGNIGSRGRLDFTVVGPAVNKVSRISSLCTSVDLDVLMSRDFVDACPKKRAADMVSLGRYALRGVSRATELFTLDPETN